MSTEEKIKRYLESKGISQAYLSNKTDISKSKLNLSLNRKRKLTLAEYELICWALDVNTDQFLEPRMPERV